MSSIVTSSIKIRSASSFLLFLTTKALEPKYAIKTPPELDVPCKKKTWPINLSAQPFSSLEIECASCRNNTLYTYTHTEQSFKKVLKARWNWLERKKIISWRIKSKLNIKATIRLYEDNKLTCKNLFTKIISPNKN